MFPNSSSCTRVLPIVLLKSFSCTRVLPIVFPTPSLVKELFSVSFPGLSHRDDQAMDMPMRRFHTLFHLLSRSTCTATALWWRRWCQWWRFRRVDGVICTSQLFQEHVSVDTRFRKVKLHQILLSSDMISAKSNAGSQHAF